MFNVVFKKPLTSNFSCDPEKKKEFGHLVIFADVSSNAKKTTKKQKKQKKPENKFRQKQLTLQIEFLLHDFCFPKVALGIN